MSNVQVVQTNDGTRILVSPVLEESYGPELILNNDFKDNMNHWLSWVNPTARASFQSVSGDEQISIQNDGEADWHIQLYQKGITLEQCKRYRVTFVSKASDTQNLSIQLEHSVAPYTSYSGRHTFATNPFISTDSCTFDFFMTSPTDTNARLIFFLGNTGINTVTIDKVSLKEIIMKPKDIEILIN
jgi:hypothetical protein